MSASALFTWAPPLPFVNELLSLVTFGVENLDDCCEDMIKLFMLAAAFVCAGRATSALAGWVNLNVTLTRRFSQAVAVAAACVVYPTADQFSDSLARHAQGLQETLQATLGLPASEPDPIDLVIHTSTAVNMIDDVIEDAFKSVCVFSHYTMGALLGGTMRRIIAGWVVNVDGSTGAGYLMAAGNAASTLVIVGTPAGRYSKCDKFGDRLGDLVQDALTEWLSIDVVD